MPKFLAVSTALYPLLSCGLQDKSSCREDDHILIARVACTCNIVFNNPSFKVQTKCRTKCRTECSTLFICVGTILPYFFDSQAPNPTLVANDATAVDLGSYTF